MGEMAIWMTMQGETRSNRAVSWGIGLQGCCSYLIRATRDIILSNFPQASDRPRPAHPPSVETVANICPEPGPRRRIKDKMAPAQPELKKASWLLFLWFEFLRLTHHCSTSTSGCLCSSTGAARSLAFSVATMYAPFPKWLHCGG